MNFFETLNLALTSITANKLRSFLTILGILIGVTSVILLVALVSGLQTFITSSISSLGPNVMFVVPGQIGGGRGPGGVQTNRLILQDANNLKSKLFEKAEVSAAIQKVSTIKFQNKVSKNSSIVGVQAGYPKIIKALKITEGRYFSEAEADSGKRVTVIGPTVKKNLIGEGEVLGKTVTIGSLKYQVIGVLQERGSSFGLDQDNVALIPLPSAQKQFGEDNIHNIVIASNDEGKTTQIQNEVKQILLKRLKEDDFTVQTATQTLTIINQITGVLTIALGGIAAISLVVGGIGIMNIMLVSVTERTKEIGLRKALGAKPKDIRNQFLIEALVLSGIGGIAGIILGCLLSLIANQFVQTNITLWSILLSFGFSMLVGIIFGVAPALRASKLDPIQALRYE